MDYYRRFREALICAALLAVPFFFLSANLRDASEVGVVDGIILQVSAPIQYVAAQAAQGVRDVLEEYFYLVDVKRDNDRLRLERVVLRDENLRLRGEAVENRRLRQLLQLRERVLGESLSAQVIAKEISPAFRVIRIRLDRDQRDGLEQGMPVISSEGLVGQVWRGIDGRYNDVLLTVDRRSSIDVVIQRTGARGVLEGIGATDSYLCRIQHLQRTDQVEPGDEVYTSGLGQRFPESILVGRVVSVNRPDHGLHQEVEVEPAVNFTTLNEVLVLTSGSRRRAAEQDDEWSGDEWENGPDGER
jgi:rod shape-determining protein MreC